MAYTHLLLIAKMLIGTDPFGAPLVYSENTRHPIAYTMSPKYTDFT